MTYIFSLLLLIHGLIHLFGFVKAVRPDKVKRLTMQVTLVAGIGWLVAACLLIVAAWLVFTCHLWWWQIAITAIVISQVLIMLSWKDARFGSLLNALILVAAVITFGSWKFIREAHSDLNAIRSKGVSQLTITENDLQPLPEPVARWLRQSGVVGRQSAKSVYLVQVGEMHTAPEGRWMNVTADQWYTVPDPAFVWLARLNVGPGIRLWGKDYYCDGRATSVIKAAGLIPVSKGAGPKTDQGALLRFLSRLPWMPSAAIQNYIRWEPLDTYSARATMTWGSVTVSGIFRFHSNGNVAAFEADRFYDELGRMEKWQVTFDTLRYQEFEGIRVPVSSESTWKLPNKDFTWYRLQIMDVSYKRDEGPQDRLQ